MSAATMLDAEIPVRDALATIAAQLKQAGIEAPRREARLLLATALSCRPADLLALESVPAGAGLDLACRRAAHEPLAYITGHREFWSLDLAVSPATLIPRPDTETLIEAALAAFPDRKRVNTILDLGTGTGALLLAALTEFPQAFGIGVDISPDATILARQNAVSLGLVNRAALIAGDWARSLDTRFDLVLSNPPYVAELEIDELMPEIRCHEPRRALAGGADGLAAYRRLLADLPGLLADNGVAIVEIGIGQEEAVVALADWQGFATSSRQDIAGVTRALVITHDRR